MGETITKQKNQTQEQTDWQMVSIGKRCIKGTSVLHFATASSISKFLQDYTSGFTCSSPSTTNNLHSTSQLNILQTMLLCFFKPDYTVMSVMFTECEPCLDSELSPFYREEIHWSEV